MSQRLTGSCTGMSDDSGAEGAFVFSTHSSCSGTVVKTSNTDANYDRQPDT